MKIFSTLLLVISMSFSGMVSADEQPATEESVKQLMQSTGASRMTRQLAQQMLPMLKKLAPDAPESFWQDFMQEINQDEIYKLVIPIYQKYLTESDLQAINDFYQTPAGQKLIQVQPNIARESMMVGQAWGQKIAKKLITKYQKLQAEQASEPNSQQP